MLWLWCRPAAAAPPIQPPSLGTSICCGCGPKKRKQIRLVTMKLQVKDPELLWLWCRPAAAAPIGPLAWEPPYATSEALKRKKGKRKKAALPLKAASPTFYAHSLEKPASCGWSQGYLNPLGSAEPTLLPVPGSRTPQQDGLRLLLQMHHGSAFPSAQSPPCTPHMCSESTPPHKPPANLSLSCRA